MIKGIIIFFVVCAVIGVIVAAVGKGSAKEGAGIGAAMGFAIISQIAAYALPVVIIIFLVKACS
jgi:hypothetical protein